MPPKVAQMIREQEEQKIFKEFEELGYEWWEYKEKKVFEMCKYDKTNGHFFFEGKNEQIR